MKTTLHQSRRQAFTLIELITVVTIIALLFSLVVGGFTYADRFSKRSKTEVTIKAVRSALENYKEEFGGYPAAQDPDTPVEIAKKSYIAGSAACLYQALSGDGFSQILGASGMGSPQSDGNLDDFETKNVMLKDMPNELWTNNGGLYYIIDGFGHPIQYTKAVSDVASTPGGTPPQPVTMNKSTYDIWSYAEDEENLTMKSIQSTPAVSAKWIKNW